MKPIIKHLLILLMIAVSTISLNARDCEANFYWQVNPNGVFSFYDSSYVAQNNNIVSWQWNFGNGNSSTNQNPTQVFSSAGTYNVCLKITSQIPGTTTTCTDSICKSVVYTCPTFISGSFSFSIQQQVVSFTSNYNSNYPPLTYEWNFGDGTPSSIFSSPQHTYSVPGTYNVCVTVTASNGCSRTECKTIVISSGINCNLAADFSFTQPAKNKISVQSQTAGGDSSNNIHVWKIGGVILGTTVGNTDTASSLFTIPNSIPDGNTQLCLKIEVPNTNCKDSVCKSITICRANGEFNYHVLANDTIQFIPPSNTTIYSHKWYANGNLFSTDISPKIKFPNNYAGMTICHVVTLSTSPACSDSFCTILQAQPCNADAAFQYTTGNNHETIFSPSAMGANWIHTWSINNITYTTQSPTVALAPDTYNVCHKVRLDGNPSCKDSICQQVIIHSSPCNLTVNISQGLNPNNQIVLEASTPNATGNYTYTWSNSATTKVINVGNHYGNYCVTVTENSTTCTATQCYNYQQPNAPLDTICGITFNDANGNGILDSGETTMGMRIAIYGNGVQTTVISDSITGEWHVYLPAGTYNICAYAANSGTTNGWVPTVPINPNNGLSPSACYTITLAPNQNMCGFNFGFQNTKVIICGYIYVDVNANGTKDPTEHGIQGQAVKVGNYTVYTNADGYYTISVTAGTYTVNFTPASLYMGYTALPASYSVAATTVGQQYCGNDFGIQVPSGQCDVAVDLAPLSTVTPGFKAIYTIKVFNLNGYTTGGLLTFNFEPGLAFYSATPLQSSFDNSAATVTWNVSNITPGTYQSFTVRLDVPQNLQPGYPVFSFAEFTTNGSCTETNLTNNIDTTHQTIVASYDPNDKHVSPEGNIANNGQELAYTIRFQNTGSAPAVNVIILDTLSDNLDWNTFEFKSSSHNCNIQQEGNLLNFTFSNIMLPDSLHDETASHGFVSYKIKTKSNLPNTSEITNRAAIYFDFNEAILTNTTLNTIDISLNVNSVDNGNVAITVFPNPFKDFTAILVNGASEQPLTIEVFDLAGRSVIKQFSENNLIQLQAGNLASGLYIYEVKQNNRVIGKGKMIAE